MLHVGRTFCTGRPQPFRNMKKLCLESAKRKYTQQRHEGTYHSLWYREGWRAEWQRFTTADGQNKFTFKEMPAHRRRLAIRMANLDKHQVADVSEGEQDFSLAAEAVDTPERQRNTVIRRKSGKGILNN
ncbi:MAG: hypothetical protein C0613_02375 [Desulfobulbaceae bacterium]|nr:MAG: hypothetical protein C0613_02375 [Desulfobulbaceae bacterium]